MSWRPRHCTELPERSSFHVTSFRAFRGQPSTFGARLCEPQHVAGAASQSLPKRFDWPGCCSQTRAPDRGSVSRSTSGARPRVGAEPSCCGSRLALRLDTDFVHRRRSGDISASEPSLGETPSTNPKLQTNLKHQTHKKKQSRGQMSRKLLF